MIRYIPDTRLEEVKSKRLEVFDLFGPELETVEVFVGPPTTTPRVDMYGEMLVVHLPFLTEAGLKKQIAKIKGVREEDVEIVDDQKVIDECLREMDEAMNGWEEDEE